ncbi:hydroxyethylthiazole kinase [Bacillus canaveralius]|uniref:Hydroxyethylthiazole kinase n=1 Tax=Bacillus canaveralius TaxID=1403243 RepID=A0A2N5GN85_9BACI|nr:MULTISPECIES: hydroxyethylthiazole kinase [Bacillus]PLR83737.1 hydroxyethylthiazole kinase [Bacillus canaveralius]PLR86667.1 hydroxyethylthiazole kinase [Bacillus sp. V33-4]PLR96423.1 hydroxyethylthiazole kinase [Bacillus canaveralius]RSK44893.1 hydroxyethylthiazole kinase [Bacillus canaveralius]
MLKDEIGKLFLKLKEKQPLVHHITNAVTINDCANVTLAIGGSPVMADSPEETAEMVAHANALVINFGTLNSSSFSAIVNAGKRANELGIPVIFDPVGVGATNYRNEKAALLLNEVQFAIIRGNHSEIASLAGITASTKGVDAGEVSESAFNTAKKAALRFNTIVVVSGETDYISDGEKTCCIANGDLLLTKITGTGCTTASLIGCFAGSGDNLFLAAVAGISTMGICGERAARRLASGEGLGTFKTRLWDEISLIDGDVWKEEVRLNE